MPGLRRDWQSGRRDRWRVARADRASLDRRNNEAFCCRSLCLFFLSNAAAADTNELRIAKQPGLSYLPAVIAEKLQLVEKQARAAGLADFKTTWTRLTNGGASNDALLSGKVDMVISGGPNMLILWAKTNGRVKGVVATGALPMLLVTNNPNVKTIADFTEADLIAVPTIRVGTQPRCSG